MARYCAVCEKKLNMMNEAALQGRAVCLDCRDGLNAILVAEEPAQAERAAERLLQKLTPNGEGARIVHETLEQCAAERAAAEETAERNAQEQAHREEEERLRREAAQLQSIREEQARREAEAEQRRQQLEQLRDQGYEGYYEYMTLSLTDNDAGGMTPQMVTEELNYWALRGWRLRSAYTNELGHNSSSSFGSGTNATIDQHVLILERFNRF